MKYSKCNFKYMVEEDFSIQTPVLPQEEIDTWYCTLSSSGELLVKRGFASDGASGWTFDTEATKQPSVEHDVFYKLIRRGFIGLSWRPIADSFLRDRLVEEGMCKFRAELWLKGLGIGGERSAVSLPKVYTTKGHTLV